MKQKMPEGPTIGRAGEFRVSSELHLRGVPCFMPFVDDGIDLVTAYGCRLQVKTSSLRTLNGWLSYQFRIWGQRQAAERPDVYVLWGREENRFWILPVNFVGSRQCLYTPSLSHGYGPQSQRMRQFDSRWESLLPDRPNLKMHKDACTGVAGVHRVASELLLRGVHVSLPVVDTGFDLLTKTGVRIQVKAGHIETRHYPEGCYTFSPKRKTVYEEGRPRTRDTRDVLSECDFVVFLGIEEGRFWIVPSRLLQRKNCITLGPQPHLTDIDMDVFRKLRSEGKSHETIAGEMGLNTTTLWNRDKGVTKMASRLTESKVIRECENRWDYLTWGALPVTGKIATNESVSQQLALPKAPSEHQELVH